MIEKTLAAKSNQINNEWLPLITHLNDTVGVMEYLLQNFISESFCVSCELDKDKLESVAKFISYVHDIGKATANFQLKISQNIQYHSNRCEHFGLILPASIDKSKNSDTPHALAGEVILRYFKCPDCIATIIGMHHGIPTASYDIKQQDLNKDRKNIVGYRNYFGDKEDNKKLLINCWQNIINNGLNISGLKSLSELPDINSHTQVLLGGLLIMADWIASNTEFFPLISNDLNISDDSIFGDVLSEQRVNFALYKANFTNMWESFRKIYSDTEFAEVFGFKPNKIQSEVLDIISRSKSSGIYIIEAPMGCGKTETALSATEILANKFKKNGLFFGLPTQATANGIFPRIQDWGEKQSTDDYHSIQLKHSTSTYNEDFQNIQKGIPNIETDSGLVVHSWFCDRKKACLSDFVIATVDQMLMMALKRKHVMLLHLGLSEKVVVIDEVHAYDAYMNKYLEMSLNWLGMYKTPVILLSATLPSERRSKLIKSYIQGQKSNININIENSTEYPLLTWTDGEQVNQTPLTYLGEHNNIQIIKSNTENIAEIVKNTVSNGGCVGIILNTVRRTQDIAEIIRNEITSNVLLYHAQYLMPDRSKKEEQILTCIGKNSDFKKRRGLVVIGTQVLEQSLDIDFDLLITDICPIDLLLQRIGRLHRHKRLRPDILQKAICYVLTDEYNDKKSGTVKIYSEWLLGQTILNLPTNITLPDDISTLVQKVYNTKHENNLEYQKYIDMQEKAKSRANTFLLKVPKRQDIHNLLDKNINDNKAEESVRDSISSIEVILMQYYDNAIHFVPWQNNGIVASHMPSDEEAKCIAKQKLRLPSIFSNVWIIDKTIDELENKCRQYITGWQNSYLLAGELVLLLDENMETELLDYKLKYSFENGLEYKRSGVNE